MTKTVEYANFIQPFRPDQWPSTGFKDPYNGIHVFKGQENKIHTTVC